MKDWTKQPKEFWLVLLTSCLEERIPSERMNDGDNECRTTAEAYLKEFPNVVAEAIEHGRETGSTQAGAIGRIVDLMKPPFYEWAKTHIPDLLSRDRNPYVG